MSTTAWSAPTLALMDGTDTRLMSANLVRLASQSSGDADLTNSVTRNQYKPALHLTNSAAASGDTSVEGLLEEFHHKAIQKVDMRHPVLALANHDTWVESTRSNSGNLLMPVFALSTDEQGNVTIHKSLERRSSPDEIREGEKDEAADTADWTRAQEWYLSKSTGGGVMAETTGPWAQQLGVSSDRTAVDFYDQLKQVCETLVMDVRDDGGKGVFRVVSRKDLERDDTDLYSAA